MNKRFEKLDSLGNKYRERLTLINSDCKLLIDGENINLRKIINYNYNYDALNSSEEFFQISAKFEGETEEKKMKTQFIIKRIKEDNKEIDIEFLKNNQKYLIEFFSDLEETVKKENFFLE